jgi:ADP-heptose:LPS heptosyltransferase
MVGAKEDYGAARTAASEWSGNAVNLCGELSPRETAVLRNAELFLDPDSGPMHFPVQQVCRVRLLLQYEPNLG